VYQNIINIPFFIFWIPNILSTKLTSHFYLYFYAPRCILFEKGYLY